MVTSLFWKKGRVSILDQRCLPGRIKYISCRTYRDVAGTIRDMAIRGAPAIGVAAAFGVALAARERKFSSMEDMKLYLRKAVEELAATRPTAVNLFWALSRMEGVIDRAATAAVKIAAALEEEAIRVCKEDVAINHAIGRHGARLLKKNSVILTHCNAGALATAGYGTALGIIRAGHERGKVKMVYVDETRPYLQGARLTAWEMKQERIPFVLITDNMAGHCMKTAGITAVIVGADRIAANGDTANKIGTYSLAVLADFHRIPFYVAAPTSTIDLETCSGEEIVIEERSSREVLFIHDRSIAPPGTVALHPAFDVTPASLITAVITEHGIFKPSDIRNNFIASTLPQS